jgi:hypothetical protein
MLSLQLLAIQHLLGLEDRDDRKEANDEEEWH